MMPRGWFALRLCALLFVSLAGFDPARAAPAADRGVSVEPLSPQDQVRTKFSPDDSYGLFVGVRNFVDEEGRPSSRIAEIPYAADDAVDLAALFVFDLKLIPAPHALLALSGEPVKPESAERLKRLIAAGALRRDTRFTNIFSLLSRIRKDAGPAGLVVVSFATHGYVQNGDRLLCEDSRMERLDRSSILVSEVIEEVSASPAPRRIVLLDACRERMSAARSVGDPLASMSEGFSAAIAKAQGMAVFSSTTTGGFSYDDPSRGNGVFTANVIEGLHGAAATDDQGFITPGTLARFLDERVRAWVARHRPEHASLSKGISMNIDIGASDMPLAVNPSAKERMKEEEAGRKKLMDVLRRHIDFKFITGAMVDEIAPLLTAPGVDAPAPLRQRLERLEREGADYAEDFALWWNSSGRGRIAAPAREGANQDLRDQVFGMMFDAPAGNDLLPMDSIVRKAAQLDDPAMKLLFSLVSSDGRGDAQARDTARALIPEVRRRASSGDAVSQFMLGIAYAAGFGVESSTEMSRSWFRKAADQNHVPSMVVLGNAYLYGVDGRDTNPAEGIRWLKKGAERGSAEAMNNLANLYALGAAGVAEDAEEAARWHRQAADRGHGRSIIALAGLYEVGRGVPKDPEKAVRWYKIAADSGSAEARSILGDMYFRGLGVNADTAKALVWYRGAADLKHSGAMRQLGWMHQYGLGVEKNDEEAMRWYRLAAEDGNNLAMTDLGAMYERGEGGEQDHRKALQWYRRSADAGNSFGMANIGRMYRYGLGVKKSNAEAIKWYRKSAEWGNAWAMNELGIMYELGDGVKKSDAEAANWYRKSAEGGDPAGINSWAVMLDNGRGVARDLDEAAKLFRRAADLGHAEAMTNLGLMYENARGLKKSMTEAVKWYRRGADAGDALGMKALGVCYDNGNGVKKDSVLAIRWYRKAADKGNAEAMNNLGVLHAFGLGVEKDDVEAGKWYRKAAELGDLRAMTNLGALYAAGRGLEKDESEAYRWYQRAADAGHAPAMVSLAECIRLGAGCDADTEAAALWYRKAADKGDALGMAFVGWLFENGYAGRKDLKHAVSWYRKAASKGNIWAGERLTSLEAGNGQKP